MKCFWLRMKYFCTSKEFRELVIAERAFKKQRRLINKTLDRISYLCINLDITNYPDHARCIRYWLDQIRTSERKKVKTLAKDIDKVCKDIIAKAEARSK